MSFPEILERIARLGIDLRVEGDTLRVEGAKEALTPDLVAGLKAEKPRILAWLRDLEQAELLALTPMQTAYLMGREEALELGGVSSHVFHEFTGHWDAGRLEEAFQRVVDRHDALRLRIAPEGAKVLPAGRVRVRLGQSDLTGGDPEQGLQAIRAGMSHQVMPVARVPLVEMHLVRTDRDMHLFVSHDGLVIDGVSMFLFFHDLMAFYNPSGAEHPAPLGVGFADLSPIMLPPADTPAAQRARRYWQAEAPRLPDAPALPLAADPARIMRPRSDRHGARLDAAAWQRFRKAASGRGLTASQALAAAFCEVLSQWSGGQDFTLNTTFANRPPVHPDAFAVIGNFTQPLPVPFRHDGITALDRAIALRKALMAGLDNRFISGIEVLQSLARPGAGSLRLPVTFNCAIDAPVAGSDGRTLAAVGQRVNAVSQTPQVWLNSFLFEDEDGLVVEVDAVAGLFPTGLVADLTGAYEQLLHLLGDPQAWDQPMFDLLPDHSRTMRESVNATDMALPVELLHDAFLRRVGNNPSAVAVFTPTDEITYGALASRAAGIAEWLGDQNGKLVGVVMNKGWEQLAAALGILMAGGAYLPVAADLPPARIAEILQSGEATHVLTQPDTPTLVPADVPVDRILVVTDALAGAVPDAGSRDAADQDALAYVLFTSGSTGKPKGVMVTHRNAVNLVTDINARFSITPDDRFFGISAFNFDLSVWDIFGALSAGAAVVLPAESDRLSPDRWVAQAAATGVTVWNSVPAIVGMALECGLPDCLRLVMMSGDKVPVDLARALLSVPGLTVMSLGGPTETTVWNVLHQVTGLSADAVRVPYGRPNGNNRLHVLDARGRPCPDWVAGDLHAAGAGVARGYWKDAARTDAAFFWSDMIGDRLYTTGDVCFWRPDGVLEILGRSDFQVKINGLRVELGEIETRLAAHPAVEKAAALAIAGAEGQQLVCACVARAGMRIDAAALSAHLANALPDYMVPQAFVALDAMPLTPNGKVDRKALIAMLADATRPGAATAAQPARAPEGEVETAVAAIWSDILKVPDPAANIAFAALGGTSLSSVRIVAEIARKLGQRITVKEFTALGSIEAVARHLQDRRALGTAAE